MSAPIVEYNGKFFTMDSFLEEVKQYEQDDHQQGWFKRTYYINKIRKKLIKACKGLDKLYSEYDKNFYKHIKKLADTEGNVNVKANFLQYEIFHRLVG